MDLGICRICCTSVGTVHLFGDNSEVASQLMYLCVRVSVGEDDGLPANICIGCKGELSRCTNFVLLAEASDRNLRHTLQQMLLLKKEEPEDFKAEPNNFTDLDSFDDVENHASPLSLDDTKPIGESGWEPTGIKEEYLEKTAKSIKKYYKKLKSQVEPNVCTLCDYIGANQLSLRSHMRKHTNVKPHVCQECNMQFKKEVTLERHYEKHHKKKGKVGKLSKYVCEACGKSFSKKYTINIHMRVHTGETPYGCPSCPSKFSQQSSLLRHVRRHSGTKPFGCNTCQKCFSTKDQLRVHLLVHTAEKKYSCPICSGRFKYQNNLNKHLKMHNELHSLVCNYCGRSFRAKGNLKLHIESQHSERSGQCSVCSKAVPNIEIHMRKHTGERPLKCELCPSTFYEQNGLAHHVNFKHKNVNKHKCPYEGCVESFPSQPMLDYHHAKLHSAILPFPCERCSRGFYRKNDLARHMIGTHKERLN